MYINYFIKHTLARVFKINTFNFIFTNELFDMSIKLLFRPPFGFFNITSRGYSALYWRKKIHQFLEDTMYFLITEGFSF